MHAKIIELYNKGLTDGEIAQELGFSRMKVLRFRQKNGLAAQNTGRPPGKKNSKPIQGKEEKGSRQAAKLLADNVIISKFGIKNEDLPNLCRSAYYCDEKGIYVLVEDGDKTYDMPRQIKKVFYGAQNDFRVLS